MRAARIFGDAFLDGFTMAGLGKLRSPASPDSLFAPEDSDARTVSFEVNEQNANEVEVQGDLHRLPIGALNSIMRAVAAEQRSRNGEEAFAHASRR